MPDVQVSFSPTANPQFTFSSNSVPMQAAGTVVLTRAPGSTWTFTGATFSDSQFTPNVPPGGATVNIVDAHTSMGSFCYTVTVLSGGTSYTSPDPVIVNEPPTPLPTPKPRPPK